MSHCKGTIKHTGTAASDKFSASQGDHFFEYACRQGCPNARVKNSQTLSLDIKLIDRMCPNFTPQMFDDGGCVLLRQLGNDILKKTSNCMLRCIYRFDNTLGFKYRLCRIIKLKNRSNSSGQQGSLK